MTQNELRGIILADPYHKERQSISEAELRLFLKEVDFKCPICGRSLQSRKQEKVDQKLFQIAHIYPNKPTIKQYENLNELERLGEDSEDFDNKIALCVNCHQTQDFRTSKSDYLKLLNIKKKLLKKSEINDIVEVLGLEDEISFVIDKLTNLDEDKFAELNYSPIIISNKFLKKEFMLKNKVTSYITNYYTFIRSQFKDIDGNNNFVFDVLNCQIKACFLKINNIDQTKENVFNYMTNWIMNKTQSDSKEACEAIVSFFIQNCEVFHEISK